MSAADIEWGLDALRTRRANYLLYQRYYDGDHRLTFASERFRSAFGVLFRAYALNLSATVVRVVSDRLGVVGWSRPGEDSASDAQELWQRAHMPARHRRVHREALTLGDAYMSVWQDPDGRVQLYDESPLQLAGAYDDASPGELAFAVKAWRERKRVRVTVYYADRIERYITKRETQNLPYKAGALRELRDDDVDGVDARPLVVNPWATVPIVHFANEPGPDGLGRSELHDVIAPQDALNKSVTDIIVTAEAHGLPLRYLIGAEPDIDPLTGRAIPMFHETRDRVVTLPKGVTVGEWAAGNVAALLDVKREHAADIAAVSGVPIHLLVGVRSAADWPSGEALRVAESRLTSKGGDRRDDWGPRWAQLVQLGLRMRQGDAGEVRSLWKPVETPLSEEASARVAVTKLAAGIPRAQVWREMGYSEAQITTMLRESDAEAADRARLASAAFDGGDDTGGL